MVPHDSVSVFERDVDRFELVQRLSVGHVRCLTFEKEIG